MRREQAELMTPLRGAVDEPMSMIQQRFPFATLELQGGTRKG